MSLFTRLFSFPMKENFPVHHPHPGIYLTCVNREDCRDTFFVNGSHNPRPVIYGVESFPPGFVKHDTLTCPVPRTNTFQTLEEFYGQDFLQTFTDCLKRSDFSTRGAKAMGFSSTVFFEGSSVSLGGGERVKANLLGATLEYPYECCMQPSFYIANVRGLQRNTPYYNPLFTTVHDFNCFPEDGCFSGGSVRNVQVGETLEQDPPYDFPKASPRSVMWYMQNAIATVQLEENGIDVDFWEDGVVGNINAIGGTLELGGLQEVLGVVAPSSQALGGNAALFSAIKNSFGSTDTPSQLSQVSYGFFSCPSTVNASTQANEPPLTTSLMYPVPDSWALKATEGDLDCCTRGTDYTSSPPGNNNVEGGQGIIPQNLLSFLVNSESQTQPVDYVPQPLSPFTCSNYHCLESPYCQSLLKRACKDFNLLFLGYCTRWRNWASNNYAAIQPGQRTASSYPNNTKVLNPPPTFNSAGGAYPSGAYMSSVDQSVFSLIDACSRTDFSQPQPMEVRDQCNGLLSNTSQQTTFPRFRPLTFDTPIQYSHVVVTPYIVDSSNNQIDIYLTYTQHVLTNSNVAASSDPFNYLNRLINRNANAGTTLVWKPSSTFHPFPDPPIYPFVITPRIENVVSFSINLENCVSLNSTTFFKKVQDNFNKEIAKLNGNFQNSFTTASQQTIVLPGSFIQANSAKPFYNSFTVNLAKTNHYLASISWVGNSITVADTLINSSKYNNLPDAYPFLDSGYNTRLENLFFLYNPSKVIWNSSIDYWDDPDEYGQSAWAQTNCFWEEGVFGIKTVSICYAITGILNNFQGFVFDQSANLVDVTQPENLARVDDKFTFVFNPSLGSFLGLGAQGNSVTVNLNPLKGGTLNFANVTSIPVTTGTVTTFSQYLGPNNPDAPITPFNLINHAEFWLTNTTPIPIYSLSVLNYSGNNLYSVTFDPSSNPSIPFLPGTSVSVEITDPSDPDNSGSISATPILFYDAGVGGWQNNFQSPDFPVLGGFLSARGIDISTQNSYGNGERFSSYTSDASVDFGEDFQGTISTILTYYKNQNVYSTGEANSGGVAQISQMFLAPLI